MSEIGDVSTTIGEDARPQSLPAQITIHESTELCCERSDQYQPA